MENIRELLMSRFGYSEQDADMLCADLKHLNQALVPILNGWIETGDCADATVHSGYSVDSLRSGFEMNFIAAILNLDWIIKEPEQALPALKSGIM